MENNTDSEAFFTLQGSGSGELEVKGSRFIANVLHAADRDKAEQHITRLSQKFHNATHNCFAYRITRDLYRFSDDGEPSGTAGKPILRAITGQNLFYVVAVVTRYFGGTKLGTGGLARAYFDSCVLALKNAVIIRQIPVRTFTIQTPYEQLQFLSKLINSYQGDMSETDYREICTVKVNIPLKNSKAFSKQIQSLKTKNILVLTAETE